MGPPLCYQLCYTCGRVQALLFCVTIYFFNRFSFSKVRASFLARFKEVNLEFTEPKAMETETIDMEVFNFFSMKLKKLQPKDVAHKHALEGTHYHSFLVHEGKITVYPFFCRHKIFGEFLFN